MQPIFKGILSIGDLLKITWNVHGWMALSETFLTVYGIWSNSQGMKIKSSLKLVDQAIF